MALRGKQTKFVEEYLIDLNATQAAIRAGYDPKTARQQGCENLTKPDIQEAIQKAQAARSERTGIRADRILKELNRLALVDPGKLYDDAGNLKKVTDLDDDTRACIAQVDSQEVLSPDGNVVLSRVKKIKLIDKLGAIDKAMRHLGLYQEKPAFEVFLASLPPELAEIFRAGYAAILATGNDQSSTSASDAPK